MKLSAVLLARTVAFIETADLNPRGRVFYPELAQGLVERYHFQKFPQELKDFNEQNGVEFVLGKADNQVIEKLTIFGNGIVVDTRTDTKTSKGLIENILGWAKSRFDLAYESGMISHFGYVSQLSFHSNVALNALNPALRRLADRVSTAVSQNQGEKVDYQTASIFVQHDPLKRKNLIAHFTIQPRVESPFSENKYFSEAPLTTDSHIEFLRDFEADVLQAPSRTTK